MSSQALAQPAQTQIPDFQPGQVLRAMELNAIVHRLNNNTSALSREGGAADVPVIAVYGHQNAVIGGLTVRKGTVSQRT